MSRLSKSSSTRRKENHFISHVDEDSLIDFDMENNWRKVSSAKAKRKRRRKRKKRMHS